MRKSIMYKMGEMYLQRLFLVRVSWRRAMDMIVAGITEQKALRQGVTRLAGNLRLWRSACSSLWSIATKGCS